MTTLDWLIAAATLLFAVNGYLRGFIVGALSLAGFVILRIPTVRLTDNCAGGIKDIRGRLGGRCPSNQGCPAQRSQPGDG